MTTPSILERSRLSKLPTLGAHRSFPLAAVPLSTPTSGCTVCGGRIEKSDDFPLAVGACRRCLITHLKVEEALTDHAKRKSEEWLKRAGGDR